MPENTDAMTDTQTAHSRAWLFSSGNQVVNRHPGDLLRLVLGSIGLAVSAVLAQRSGVGRLEADIFQLIEAV